MGVATEFSKSREKLALRPVTQMKKSIRFKQPAGTWSDSTSMEIATIESYIENNGFNCDDIMRRWTAWVDHGEYACNGVFFGTGKTVLKAIKNYNQGVLPRNCGLTDISSNGNGSLMRVLPVALYSYSKKLSDKEIIKLVNDISSLTHAHDISKLGCYIYTKFVIYLLKGFNKQQAYNRIQNEDYSSYSLEAIHAYKRVLRGNITNYKLGEINSSSYVVHTLESALWILLNQDNYKDTIIASTNIGNDTDTIGAVVGSMAGIIYGYNAIPKDWLNSLRKKDYLMDLSLNFEKTICEFKKDIVMGAIIGDIAGSRFEFNYTDTGKDFILLHQKYDSITDDTVMTLAVAKTILKCNNNFSNVGDIAIDSMVEIGKQYPECGYGNSFYNWINSEEHAPYNSYGNGAAMRISPVAASIENKEQLLEIAEEITNISHNHPDSINGVKALCTAIFLARNGADKKDIKEEIEKEYFKLNGTVEELKNSYETTTINCIDSVRLALISFLESYDFEDTVRNAISLGGDTDTIAAIAGSIAAAYYGIPEDIYDEALKFLDPMLRDIHDEFEKKYSNRKVRKDNAVNTNDNK